MMIMKRKREKQHQRSSLLKSVGRHELGVYEEKSRRFGLHVLRMYRNPTYRNNDDERSLSFWPIASIGAYLSLNSDVDLDIEQLRYKPQAITRKSSFSVRFVSQVSVTWPQVGSLGAVISFPNHKRIILHTPGPFLLHLIHGSESAQAASFHPSYSLRLASLHS